MLFMISVLLVIIVLLLCIFVNRKPIKIALLCFSIICLVSSSVICLKIYSPERDIIERDTHTSYIKGKVSAIFNENDQNIYYYVWQKDGDKYNLSEYLDSGNIIFKEVDGNEKPKVVDVTEVSKSVIDNYDIAFWTDPNKLITLLEDGTTTTNYTDDSYTMYVSKRTLDTIELTKSN